jgi:hypothetical protein
LLELLIHFAFVFRRIATELRQQACDNITAATATATAQ